MQPARPPLALLALQQNRSRRPSKPVSLTAILNCQAQGELRMAFDNSSARALALSRIQTLRALADDLARIVEGTGPTEADLASAPQLYSYRISHRMTPCLIGFTIGHPTVRDGPITTSELFAADPERRWVRTLSCYYRLEKGVEEARKLNG